jgi:hypothetical protein
MDSFLIEDEETPRRLERIAKLKEKKLNDLIGN